VLLRSLAILRRSLAVLGIIAAPHAGFAQTRSSSEYPSVLTYRTVRVAEGVYAFITPEERSSFQAGNSVAIVGDDGVLVFDTGNIPSATRHQIAEIRRLTPKPVRWVVNSHWHPDHTLGNAEYREAFPGLIVIGTSATRTGILERVPAYVDQMKSFAPIDSVMRVRLATGKMRDGSPMPDAVRLTWGLTTRDYAEFMPEVVRTTPSAPDLVFDDSLTITLGKRRVQIVRPGRGNTAGDAFLFLPDERVLLTGDLVTVPCPFPGTAYFADWIRSLDALVARHAATIVPGHGDVQHDYAYVAMVRELIAFTLDRARDAVTRGVTLEDFQKQIDFAPFAARFAGDDPVRRDAFSNFYVQAAVPRAYEEAKTEVGTSRPSGRRRLSHRVAVDRRTIQRYSQTTMPAKPSRPSHFAGPKSSGTSPIGASFENATMSPALSTPHRLSPTMSPDATSVASRSARSGSADARVRTSYHFATTEPMITARVADIGR
jgi:cyclase